MMQAKQKFSVVRVGAVFTVVLLLVALVAAHYRYAPRVVEGAPASDLQKQIGELTAQVERLKQEQGMPASVLDHYRNSVGFIYGVYRVGFANQRPSLRVRSAGTGFLIGNGLVATNRHSRAMVRRREVGSTDPSRSLGHTRELGSFLSRLADTCQAPSCFGLEDFGSSHPAHGKLGCYPGSPGIAFGESGRFSWTSGYAHRLSHGNCRDVGKIADSRVRAVGLSEE